MLVHPLIKRSIDINYSPRATAATTPTQTARSASGRPPTASGRISTMRRDRGCVRTAVAYDRHNRRYAHSRASVRGRGGRAA